METTRYSCVFWSKDESDADLTDMAQRSAHVPGVTDTVSSQRKTYSAQLHLSSLHNKQKLNMHQSHKKKELASVLKSSMTSENSTKKDDKSAAREPPSLKDLRPEDKKRVANLIRELAKTGEEKEVAKEQLEVERRENELKTRNLQNQIEAILRERENIQQQYLECQRLLSAYQSKVSEEQRNLSGSLQDGSSSNKGHKPNDHWSPIKESARTLSPTSAQHASKKDPEFMELQSVPVQSNEDKSCQNGEDFIDPQGPGQGYGVPSKQQSPNSHHGISSRQFNPVLSSTHRPHHRSRVPSAGTEDIRTAQSENKVNGFSSTHRHEQSKQSDFYDLPKAHGSQRDGSRTSQETFLPLTEVTDDSNVHAAKRKGRESRKSSDRNSWVSLPEMDGHVPSSYELHQRGQGQNETTYLNGSPHHVRSLPASMSDAKFSGQRQDFEGVASSQYGKDYQTEIQAHHQGHSGMRNSGPKNPKYDDRTHQERQDYRNLTPEQRQRQLGSLKKKLQQEQGWLQQKLQEQERLLYYKRLEIERQKEEQSQLDDNGYEQVRRKYLGKERSGEQYRTRTGVGDEYRTGFVDMNGGIQEDGYHHQRLVPEGGRNEVSSAWQRNVPLDEENLISTNYPPDDFREFDRQGMTGRKAGHQFDQYRQGYIVGYDEDSDLHYQDDSGDGDEVEDDETWYEMREETEGADNRGSIQGYASLHPQQDARRQAATNPATFHSYQSYPTSDLGDTVNGADVRLKRGYPSRIREPQKQFGNITALLEEEGLAGVSLNGSNPPHTRPGTMPRPVSKANIRPRPSHQFPTHAHHQGELRTHPASPGHLRERDKVTMELYTPQSGQGKNQRITAHPSAGQDMKYSTHGKRTDQGHLYSYTDPAKDDALHAHLVQRSHQVIQEIGMLLNQSAEMGEEEESKVLEDVFFLK